MKRTWLLLSLVALSACGDGSSNGGAPDAGTAFCRAAAQQCSVLADCALVTGDCSEAQQAVVLDCLTNGVGSTCSSTALALCYDMAFCVYGGTPPVCGDGTCGPGESFSCAADCPSPTCGHDECTVGLPLDSSCTACTASVCATDAFCCATEWDATCIMQAQSLCGLCP